MAKKVIEPETVTKVITDQDELEDYVKQYHRGIRIAEETIASLRGAVIKFEERIQEYRKHGRITIIEEVKK